MYAERRSATFTITGPHATNHLADNLQDDESKTLLHYYFEFVTNKLSIC